ncbi:methionine--tRNA ligase [Parasphingorhabdus halotolerans]|uniref:Methionine--tRNA ligase n=1 Tax=Parasphingorhabdus halotolerans TaxID=2725558 RepID=A0A6H2DHT6_9SPHN|nr:methionine--tRNA ligase [Parasphingorhabdus halotolerans]QJB68232.1 methionine--tRNA ligase [Parasphingorhabdus halotolerans]
MTKPYYITTAISYPNGPPHIGHAYEVIATDAIARFHRLMGRDVRFQTGTDEHGLKMAQAAEKRGIAPQQLADEMSIQFIGMCDKLNISHDRFIRTTEADHHAASQAIWQAMETNGDLYLDKYEGWYSVRDEAYYDESELIEAEGKGGSKERLSPQGTPVEWTVEESWFFRLSKYQEPLLKIFRETPEFLQPESRRNEMIKFVEGGLRDLSMSRTSFDWGVKVPGSDKHVMYVWIDALTNYLTGLGYPEQTDLYPKFWSKGGDIVHVIGKDIVRFHTVYWPAFLMSAKLPLPKHVYGHGFVLNRGVKMSKSVGNVVDPINLAETFGVDQLRYFLLSDVVFGKDGTYSPEMIVTKTNADLANNFGNLAQRSLSMIAKNCDGKIPAPGTKTDADEQLITDLQAAFEEIQQLMQDSNVPIHAAIDLIRERLSATNQYFADSAPWALRKTDPERADTVLYYTAEAIRRLAIMLQWVIPESCAKMLDMLSQQRDNRGFAHFDTNIQVGLDIPAPTAVFPRLEVPASEGEG